MPYSIARFIGRRQPAIFAALPPTAFLPRKNSTGLFGEGKSDDGKEEDAGILAYAKDDDAVSADLHPEKRVCPCQAKVVSLLDKRTDILSARWLLQQDAPQGTAQRAVGRALLVLTALPPPLRGAFYRTHISLFLSQRSSQCCTRPMALSQPRKLRSRTSAVICGVYSLSSVHCSRISSRSCHTPVARPAR